MGNSLFSLMGGNVKEADVKADSVWPPPDFLVERAIPQVPLLLPGWNAF